MKDEHYTYNVLVIGDRKSELEQFFQALQKDHPVFLARTKDEVEIQLKEDFALVIADQRVLEMSEINLEEALETHPETLWILLVEEPNPKTVAQVIDKTQIYYYLKKPQDPKEILMFARRALEHHHLSVEHQKLLEKLQALQEQHQLLQGRKQDIGLKTKGEEQTKEISLTDRNSEESYPELRLRSPLDQVIQSDKMATLGQMVAGIAHEINTPSGAISAAIVNMNHHLKSLIESFWGLDEQKITREDFQWIMKIVANMASVLDGNQRRSPGEIRVEQKRIAEMLQQQGVQNSRKLAKYISQMDLTENIDELLVLAKTYDIDIIFTFLTHCSRIINSARDIKLSTDMLTRIVRALKSYSYPRQEKPELADIHESIDTALTILNNKLKHRIHVKCQRGSVPRICCYASELTHVWINIIHNAIQAIDDEGEILIETFTTETYLGVKITDNGLGIPAEIRDRIFDVDFTTKPQGEGTGLGLYIAHQIIEKHEGTIDVISSLGKTTFEVHLPLSTSSCDSKKSTVN